MRCAVAGEAEQQKGEEQLSSLILRGDCLKFLDPISRLALRPSFAIEEGRRHPRVGELFFPPHDPLMNQHRGCADLLDSADDLQIVAEPAGLAVADIDLDHRISAAAGASSAAWSTPTARIMSERARSMNFR